MCEEYDSVIWDNPEFPCISGHCEGFVRKSTEPAFPEQRGQLVVFWTKVCKAHNSEEYRESDPITANHVIIRKV